MTDFQTKQSDFIKNAQKEIVGRLRAGGFYYEAGVYAQQNDMGRDYGCHFGMKSTLERDRNAFYLGYDNANSVHAATNRVFHLLSTQEI